MSDLTARHLLFAVLILPPMGCPTKDVYQAFDAGHQPPEKVRANKTNWQVAAASTAEEMDERLVNDLEPAAFFVAPALAGIRKRAEAIAERRVHLTGSGSTLFVLCPSGHAAGMLEEKLNRELGEGCVSVAARILSGS